MKKENQILLQQIIDCWNKYRLIDLGKIVEIHKNFDFNYFLELCCETFYYKCASNKQLKLSEDSIIKFFKEDIIQELNTRLIEGKITYDDFMIKMKKIDDMDC